MEQTIQIIFSTLIFVFLLSSIYFSVKSRSSKEPIEKGILTGRLNISMGAMLIFLAIIQLFNSNESTLRIILGAIFLLIGLFNLFAGLRNLSYYQKLKEKSGTS